MPQKKQAHTNPTVKHTPRVAAKASGHTRHKPPDTRRAHAAHQHVHVEHKE